jgi:chromosome segregation ATPase
MNQAIDWEAQIEEIRMRATAAARHSERTVGGLAQALSETAAQSRTLASLDKGQQEINSRLGTLEQALRAKTGRLEAQPSEQTSGLSTRLLCGLIGLLFGVVVSGVFFWN